VRHGTLNAGRVFGLALAFLTAFEVAPARAQVILPGSPQARVPNAQAAITLAEPAADTADRLITVILPVTVNSGFLVLTEDGASQAPSNWSDVVFFHIITLPTGALAGEARLVSDAPGATGMTDADVAPLGTGITIAAIQAGANTQYRPEVALGGDAFGAFYAAPNPNLPPGPPGTMATLTYTVISEVPEPSTLVSATITALIGLGFAWCRRNRFSS
jgi:hypothetical protein